MKIKPQLEKTSSGQNEPDELKALFQTTFEPIVASDEYRSHLKETLKTTKRANKIRKEWYMVAAAACLVLFIGMGGMKSVKAAVTSIYEHFFQDVSNQYEQVAKDYGQKVDQTETFVDGISINLTEYLLLNDGIDLRYKLTGDAVTEETDVTVNELTIKTMDKKEYQFEQEMLTCGTDGYLASFVCKEKDADLKELLGENITITVSFLYEEEEVVEKDITFSTTPQNIYTTQENLITEEIAIGDSGYIVKSIRYDAWYMRLEYTVNEETSEYPLLDMTTNDGKSLLFLGGSALSEKDNTYYEYMQMPEQPTKELTIRPAVYAEENENYIDVRSEDDSVKIKIEGEE